MGPAAQIRRRWTRQAEWPAQARGVSQERALSWRRYYLGLPSLNKLISAPTITTAKIQSAHARPVLFPLEGSRSNLVSRNAIPTRANSTSHLLLLIFRLAIGSE